MGVITGNPYFRACDEIFTGREGTPLSISYERNYTRRFQVEVLSKEIGPLGVCQCPGLPTLYEAYSAGSGEYDLLAVCTKITASQRDPDDWKIWTVVAHYNTIMGENYSGPPTGFDNSGPQTENSPSNNPELEPPEIDWDGEDVMIPEDFDLDEKAYVNSANDRFIPVPAFPKVRPILNVKRNFLFANFNQAFIEEYANSVNSDSILGCLPGQIMLMKPTAQLVFRGSLSYWSVHLQFKIIDGAQYGLPFHPSDGYRLWQPRILDQGYNELDTRSSIDGVANPNHNKKMPIKGNGIMPITQQQLLDGNGRVQTINEDGSITPFIIRFRQFHEREFGPLLVGTGLV